MYQEKKRRLNILADEEEEEEEKWGCKQNGSTNCLGVSGGKMVMGRRDGRADWWRNQREYVRGLDQNIIYAYLTHRVSDSNYVGDQTSQASSSWPERMVTVMKVNVSYLGNKTVKLKCCTVNWWNDAKANPGLSWSAACLELLIGLKDWNPYYFLRKCFEWNWSSFE